MRACNTLGIPSSSSLLSNTSTQYKYKLCYSLPSLSSSLSDEFDVFDLQTTYIGTIVKYVVSIFLICYNSHYKTDSWSVSIFLHTFQTLQDDLARKML